MTNSFIEEGISDLERVLDGCPLTKHCFFKKAEKQFNSPMFRHKMFVGDMSTSLMMPAKVRETMLPLVRKWGYDVLEEIAQEYLNRQSNLQSWW